MGRLSTHVLDTSRGMPAAGVRVQLHAIRGSERHSLSDTITNADGRTGTPLLTGAVGGVYELTFHVSDYFAALGVPQTSPPFLSEIVIRVGIADPDSNHHVPLLLSPYGYSTYRGS